MKNLLKLENALLLITLIGLPFLVQAQEVKVENGNVKIKTAGTVVETKNGNVKVKTNANTTTTSTNSTKVGVKNIAGNNLKQTIVCNGVDVTITGNENNFVIKGYVKNLKLTGSDNTVKVEKIISIKALGSDNEIVYKSSPNKSGKATVSAVGSDNSIYKQLK